MTDSAKKEKIGMTDSGLTQRFRFGLQVTVWVLLGARVMLPVRG